MNKILTKTAFLTKDVDMFRQKTTFILGAGASSSYGYPLGTELIKQIIQTIKNDKIILPHRSCPSSNKNNTSPWTLSEINNIIESHALTAIDDMSKIDEYKLTPGEKNIIHILIKGVGNHYQSLKLNKIKELYELSEKLEEFAPISIDAFLRDHKKLQEVGKFIIAYCLLSCENMNKFNSNKNKDHWYPYLMNDILSGGDDLTQIKKSTKANLHLVTFNYDISLDYWLKDRLSKTPEFAESPDNRSTILNIHHVYGKIDGEETDLNDYGTFSRRDERDCEFEGSKAYLINTFRFRRAYSKAANIRIIRENSEEENLEKLRSCIKDADQIKIIGFGFDRDNLKRLNFPQNEAELRNFLKRKELHYLDYDGKLNTIHQNFQQIKEKCPNFSFVRSSSKSITDAYQNDFKLSLFDITKKSLPPRTNK